MKLSTTSKSNTENNRIFDFKSLAYKISAIAFWIIVWEALALYINSQLIIASPVQVAKRLWELIFTPEMWRALGFSFIRISSGFVAALVLGTVLAALSSRLPIIKALLSPITTVIKSTPIASFIILAIIWFGSRYLSIFISFLMVFPVIYLNILKGIESLDPKLSEMAEIYKLSPGKRLAYVFMPQLMPFVISACSVGLGLCWKSGVAAEVIGISTGSIGERLYRAKLYFETGDLLAWTVIIILISTAFEKLIMAVLKHIQMVPFKVYGPDKLKSEETPEPDYAAADNADIHLKNISKSFNGVAVLNGISADISRGSHIALTGRSGAGKTTLTRIISGLEKPDSGEVAFGTDQSFGYVFQEDRLIEQMNAVGNIAIAGASPKATWELLQSFRFTEELAFKPTRDLSGGEKRRVAIARALLSRGDILIFDEPFKGIDEETINSSIIPKVKEYTRERTLILITHSDDEAKELCGEQINI